MKKEKEKERKEYLSSRKEDSQHANFNFNNFYHLLYKYIYILLFRSRVYENCFLIDKIRGQKGGEKIRRGEEKKRKKNAKERSMDGEHDKVKFVT